MSDLGGNDVDLSGADLPGVDLPGVDLSGVDLLGEGATDRERWAAAAVWSHRAMLDPLETTMWRSERHPSLSATSAFVIMLDREPEWARFFAAHDWGTQLVHRLRQRVLEPAVPTVAPRWVEDDHFALAYHLQRRPVGGDGELSDVLEEAQGIALAPFDRTRPLWQAVLLTGLTDGRAAYVLKVHHAMADALGSVQLLSMLQSHTPEHTPDKPTLPPVHEEGPTDAVQLAAAGAIAEIGAAPSRLAALVGSGLSTAADPRGALGEGLRYAASLRRLAAASPAPASPLFVERDGRSWGFISLTASLADLRAAGRGVGASLQDAFIAALLGGLRRYHNLHDVAIDDLPVSIRVSLDRADDPMSGNRFAGAMIPAPVGVIDPVDRIAAVRGEVLSLHVERALDAFRAVAPLTSRLPSDLVAALLQAGAVADVSVAVTAGPTRPSYMAGARVEEMYSFGPLPGVAISASLLTFGDRACIGLNVDRRAVPDLAELHRCLQEGLDEVLAVVG